jgi:hypothetical protein
MSRSNRSAVGHGRLAQVVASRSGLAAPEVSIVLAHREALIYTDVLTGVADSTMPCDGAWATQRAAVFRRSVDSGTPG